MSVTAGYPPNYDAIVARFGDAGRDHVYTYAPTIYVPSGRGLSPDLVIHEGHHLKQQADVGGPDVWWARYLEDDPWRLAQELEAYRLQMVTLRRMIPDRNEFMRVRVQIAGDLAGPMYGRLMTFNAAMTALG